MGCFSGLAASAPSPGMRAALESADAATASAVVFMRTHVVPAVAQRTRAASEFVQENALPALRRGWVYLRDVAAPAAQVFVLETAVPAARSFANDVVLPAVESSVAYTRHVVVPTAVAHYHYYASGVPLPPPGSFAPPVTAAAAWSESTPAFSTASAEHPGYENFGAMRDSEAPSAAAPPPADQDQV